MMSEGSKVTADHLRRDAYLYVRQSTLHQVADNRESTKRQYGLKERAVGLGWPLERVVVIDEDLGQSASGATERTGFERLVGEVGLGKAGLVLGLEVSRLARSSTEWHRLLEICALTDTLILDEDGLYDPGHFNDRLLLGLKGTMSEAELHVLRARLQGGLVNKARRGELRKDLPTGLVYEAQGQVVRDPDERVRSAVELFFETFRRVGSAWGVVRYFREEELGFPTRLRRGPNRGEVVFGRLNYPRAIQILHNPRYAGAYVWGRTRTRRTPQGGVKITRVAREEWPVLIPDVHEGYISWQDYEENLRRLRENAQARGQEGRSPAREGPALLQGLALCGRCGERMRVAYRVRAKGVRVPSYRCTRHLQHGGEGCHTSVPGQVDEVVGKLLVEAMTPLSLEVSLQVSEELRARAEEVDRLRRQEVERARYEAELAERRYRRVDPDNRHVAAALEADWNAKLRELANGQERYEREREADRQGLDESRRQEVLCLATDFPLLWRDPKTPHREKKRMARLLIEDVTLTADEEITAHVRFRGGAIRTLIFPRPRGAPDARRTDPAVLKRIDRLLDDRTDAEIAEVLNREGLRTGTGLPFNRDRVWNLRIRWGIKSRYDRLRAQGWWTRQELAAHLNVSEATVRYWTKRGRYSAIRADRYRWLYQPPAHAPGGNGTGAPDPSSASPDPSHLTNPMQ
jgi:DNA invertase Pin-like site-specific DNA recombinase